MEEVQYIGETLWLGQLGHAFIVAAFVASLLGLISYSNAVKNNDATWKSLGRLGFTIHGISTLSLIALLFYLMMNQMYEYRYVWEHVSVDLPMKYILSAFWEGQEGSFLLWMFWHIILGFILIFKAKRFEAPVMAVFCMMELILSSMILGIHIGFGEYVYKLGINPTLLLRETMDAPIFANAEYLNLIKGQGLNPLLQNYWMTIHPPTLFLGFASVTVPFAYAIAGLWTKDHKAWLDDGLKWSLFSCAILGTGILMGSAWAYEALSFGGYWAWDPVENMSLVPWLVLIGGLHTNLIAKATGRSIGTTYVFYILSLSLVIYSTFLTRSGVLGDTSAHAFTEMGLEWQLVIFIAVFLLGGFAFFFKNRKSIPSVPGEEGLYSREFWMYIGSFVLMFSGVLISVSTSVPVYNAIKEYFDPAYMGQVIEEPIEHYNKYQLWISILIGVISSVAIHLQYRIKPSSSRLKSMLMVHGGSLVMAGVLTYLYQLWIDYFDWRYALLTFASFYAILANAVVLFTKAKQDLKMGAAAISHIGFGLMIIGIIASGLNDEVVSKNPFAMQGIVKDQDLSKVVRLIKNEPLFVEGYWITYTGDTIDGQSRFFDINFRKTDEQEVVLEEFTVRPNVLFSNDFSKIAATNPDTKHYLTKDIFTHIASLPMAQMDVKFAKEQEDTLVYEKYDVAVGDTLFTKKAYAILKEISFDPNHKEYKQENAEFGISTILEFKTLDSDTSFIVEPALGLSQQFIFNYGETIDELGLKLRLNDSLFYEAFTADDDLQYQKFSLKKNEIYNFEELSLSLKGLNRTPELSEDNKEEGDIAISTQVDMNLGVNTYTLEPIYIIRGNRPISLKAYEPKAGVHLKMTSINPKSETFNFEIARDNRNRNIKVPVEIAENVPRSDIIVLEARMFPGINLFWLGTILMMFGFLMALVLRRRQKS